MDENERQERCPKLHLEWIIIMIGARASDRREGYLVLPKTSVLLSTAFQTFVERFIYENKSVQMNRQNIICRNTKTDYIKAMCNM